MMVQASDLRKQRKRRMVVDGVSLQVERGQSLGLLGVNGAGKSSLLRLLLGLDRPTSGRVLLAGMSVIDASVAGIRACLVTDGAGGPRERRLLPHLEIQCVLAGIPPARARDALGYVGLAADADTRIGHCSSGMRQRLSLAAAQLAPCDLLVLDEPATSLDPQGSHLVEELVARTTDAGGAVIVASHDLRLIARVCTSFAFMRAGRLSDTIGLRDAISSAAAVESFADKSEASLERWLWLTSFGDESGV